MAKTKKKAKAKKSSKASSGAKSGSKDVENGKVCALLAYFLVGIIWYFADEKMKKNKFANFHAKQGLVLLIVWILGIAILSVIVFIGWILIPIYQLLMIILLIFGIINSLNGNQKELPIIGRFAKNFKF